ncbi:DUF4325 domain-containing protein [soil metagenome]
MRQKPPFSPKQIIDWMKKNPREPSITSSMVVKQFDVSRATAARILKAAVDEGLLQKQGSTRSASYAVATNSKSPKPTQSLRLEKNLNELSESKVFDEVALRLNLKSDLSDKAFRIAQYAFSEMLNNAIDHSNSKKASIDVSTDKGVFSFTIRDHGIGIFKKLRETFELQSDEEAIEHLLKGKQTSAPEAHSGQGIFFTSKISDVFSVKSDTFELTIDNEKSDQRLAETRSLKGTEVSFRIKAQTRKSLENLFRDYANDDFEFDRSKIPIRILEQTGAVSRSQARRLTFGLEKFDRIIFDFKGVKELGQGFADELFRIFQARHPELVLEIRNANSAVDFMIRRARAD